MRRTTHARGRLGRLGWEGALLLLAMGTPLALMAQERPDETGAPDPDLTGPWSTEAGDHLLMDPRASGGWVMRTMADGGFYLLAPEGDLHYAVTDRAGEDHGSLAVSGDLTSLTWDARGGEVAARRIPIDRTNFRAGADDGVELYGTLFTPRDVDATHLVLLVHGAEDTPATRRFWLRDVFLARGFTVALFDKRGTGSSEGAFTMDFDRLAADVRAAGARALDLLDEPPESFALAGFSQGGWVAPLAASGMEGVDYVLVGFGLVDSPHDEAYALGMRELTAAGLSPAESDQIGDLLRSALDVVACDYRCGWERYRERKEAVNGRAWLETVSDPRVQALLEEPEWVLRLRGVETMTPLTWHYRSEPLLENWEVPTAWFIAEDDSIAPPEYTIAFLERMISEGKPYALYTYPDVDHAMMRFEVEEGGGRRYTTVEPAFYADLIHEAVRLSGAR